MIRPRGWIVLGALLGGLGVALGAFGAHGLDDTLAGWGVGDDEIAARLATFETAVRYHMYHALALVGLGLVARWRSCGGTQVAGWSFLLGIAVFSGLLYALVLSGVKVLGAIVPLGGVAFLVGWASLAWVAWRMPQADGGAACGG